MKAEKNPNPVTGLSVETVSGEIIPVTLVAHRADGWIISVGDRKLRGLISQIELRDFYTFQSKVLAQMGLEIAPRDLMAWRREVVEICAK